MDTARYEELYQAELRMAACGCEGACSACQAEPRPLNEEEEAEYLDELAANS